jgi:quercetin dioxygenase-like cupin family protein
MGKLSHWGRAALAVPWLVAAHAEAPHGGVQNTPDMTFASFPGMPACVVGAVVDGDPPKGPSVVALRAAAGCAIPWHWHTANERLTMVAGTAHVQTKDGKSLPLTPGGFALMPSKHVHRFSCDAKCMLYVHSDTPFDIHYVDTQGNEISPDQALKGAGRKAKKPK